MGHTIEELRHSLCEVAEPSIAPDMSRYMRGRFEYLGVKAPARRAAAGAWIRQVGNDPDKARQAVTELWAQPEREFQYVGIDLVARVARHLDAPDIDWLADLVVSKSWWDTVDSLAVSIGAVALEHPLAWETIEAWSFDTGLIDTNTEPSLWLARCSILQQLKYRDRTDEDVLFERCSRRAADTDFFIRKAIGWALRQYARTAPQSVWLYVDQNRDVLSALSVREATKHL